MIVSGFQKLSLLDYPGKMAAIIFTQGCNYKCKFCQNSDLINFNNECLISEDEILNYLKKRKGILDALVISGGEPTVQKDLKDFIVKVKELGYLVKLDTNGTNSILLNDLINNKLIDYVAMDIKITFDNYEKVVNVNNCFINNIKESINILKNSKISHEFRTTIIKNYHEISDIEKLCDMVGVDEKYFLQNFEDSQGVIDKSLRGFSKEELISLENNLKLKYPNVKVRGI